MNRPTPYVIFGAGQLALAIMEELTARGEAVALVNRKGHSPEPLPSNVQVTKGDATNSAEVAALTRQAQVVFHAAQPEYHQWPTHFPPITRGILDGVAQTNARLIFGDNLYMYGPTRGAPIHEGLPYAATGHKGKTRAQMAQSLLDAHAAGRVRVAIGRASDFYGPRVRGSALGELFWEAALANKTVSLLGNVDLPHTYTYIRDFARALVTLSDHDEALGQAWHVPNAETLTTRQLVNLAAEELGHPIKLRTAGRTLLTLLGLVNPSIREMKELVYEFEEPYIVDHSRFAQAFGSHVTPHREALRETIAWWRRQGVPQAA